MKPRLRNQLGLFLTFAIIHSSLLKAQDCPNLVANGDFSSGQGVGYTSDYEYDKSFLFQGKYTIGNNPQSYNNWFVPLTDHTSGTGEMFIVDAALDTEKAFWKTHVPVKAGMTYAFSVWIANIHRNLAYPIPDTTSTQSAKFQFVIDGKPLSDIKTLSDTLWRNYTQLYTSTKEASVEIALRNTANPFPLGGNDLAMDDIEFREVCTVTGYAPNLLNENTFKVYPNPVHDGVLYFGKTARSYRLLSVDKTLLLAGTDASSLSTEGLAKGIYFLYLEDTVYKVILD